MTAADGAIVEVAEVPDFTRVRGFKVLGFAAARLFPASLNPPCPFSSLPLALPLACLPFSFRFSFNALFNALAACFSAFFKALRRPLAFTRSRSARASAPCFLRFFSQAAHLQPIGFRYALK